MNGIIRTYLPEKKYGFIRGDDGKDYFFHQNAFRNKKEKGEIAEDAFVTFDQKATPKGYQAFDIVTLDKTDIMTYIVPDNFLTSQNSDVRGWEIIEVGEWIVHGSSRNSPDEAKRDAVDHAIQMGANGLIEMEYHKTTGSEPGEGQGTHYYSIHNYSGRIVSVAKKNRKGNLTKKDLIGLNQRASELKSQLSEKTRQSKIRSNKIWVATLILISIYCLFMAMLPTINKLAWMIGGSSIIVLIGIYLGGEKVDYDYWLQMG